MTIQFENADSVDRFSGFCIFTCGTEKMFNVAKTCFKNALPFKAFVGMAY